jgi:hypothetical protein
MIPCLQDVITEEAELNQIFGTPSAVAIRKVTSALTPSYRRLIEASAGILDDDDVAQAVGALSLTIPREPFGSLLAAKLHDADLEVRLATITSLMDLRPRRIGDLTTIRWRASASKIRAP